MPRITKWLGIEDLIKAAWEIVTQLRIHNKHMSELNDRLLAIETGLDEATTEITAELTKLREQVANGDTTAALETITRLEGKTTTLRNISPPIPPPTP